MPYKQIFVDLLPERTQKQIKQELEQLQLEPIFIKMALRSRLCDLEDVIDISKYLDDNTK